MPEAMTQKKFLRTLFQQRRQSLSTASAQQKSELICGHLRDSQLFQQSTSLLGYWACQGEPSLERLFSEPKQWGLPRCVGKQLAWHHYHPGDRLISGKFGILEPQSTAPTIDLSAVNLVLVPAIACSKDGARLGYGGGFYDRFFSQFPSHANWVGIVFECCLAEMLPRDPWDIPLDHVCTERQLYSLPARFGEGAKKTPFNDA